MHMNTQNNLQNKVYMIKYKKIRSILQEWLMQHPCNVEGVYNKHN
jgi:hypothetical protein